jgi:hypothetical protein
MILKSYFIYQENYFRKHQSKLDNESRLHEQSLFSIFIDRYDYWKQNKDEKKKNKRLMTMGIAQNINR